MDNSEVIYEFLDRRGVSDLSKALLTKVNSRIQQRIVSNIDESSDEKHVPSAKAVYDAISKMSHIKFKTYTGNINNITSPNPSYIYLQRDTASDATWMMYIYDEEFGWINVGDTDVNLSNYWSKDPNDVEALKIALGFQEEIDSIKSSINNINQEIQDINLTIDTISDELSNKVDKEQMVKFTEEEVISAVDEAFIATMPTI